MSRNRLIVASFAALFALQSGAFAAKIGNASATKNEVEGVIGSSRQQISSGSDVFNDEHLRTGRDSIGEFVFLDSTKLSLGPVSEIKLDKFVYDPNGSNSRVVLNATRGAFRFVTGVLDKRAYSIVTPVATLGVRGTAFELSLLRGFVVHVTDGVVTVTTRSGRVYEVHAGEMLTITPQGQVIGPEPAPPTILEFASLDGPTFGELNVPIIVGGAALVGGGVAILIGTHHHHHGPISP